MTRAEIQTRIVAQLAKIAPDTNPAAIDPEADFRDALDIDSMDVLNVLTAVHSELGVDIPDRDQGRLMTLRALTDYVAERLANLAPR